MNHIRQSPGIELNEIDRSSYNDEQNYAVTNTVSHIAGFTDKGENYTTNWINSIKTYIKLYGTPKNEIEKYAFNGVNEILQQGGICLFSKLPYDNISKDKYTSVRFELSPIISSDINNKNDDNLNDDLNNDEDEEEKQFNQNTVLKLLKETDESLTSFVKISVLDDQCVTQQQLDEMIVKNRIIQSGKHRNLFQIVDITHGQYEKNINNKQCIGIMPVIVGAGNALYFQNIISSENIYEKTDEYSTNIENFNIISGIKNRSYNLSSDNISETLFITQDECAQVLQSYNIYDNTISKIAIEEFPKFQFLNHKIIDKTDIHKIAVIVFRLYVDSGNNSLITFELAESFVGSLDIFAKNEKGQSEFIGDIINQQSELINFFTTIKDKKLLDSSLFLVENQVFKTLGFYENECFKTINYKTSIIEPLTQILNHISDPNTIKLDLVVDAGISNIAQFVQQYYRDNNANTYPFKLNDDEEPIQWEMTNDPETLVAWRAVLSKFDNFCKNIRRDCMFIADGYRPLVLDGNQKKIRYTNVKNTIENTIVPKIKYMSFLNSSFTAGYCNWFLQPCAYTNDVFWCPPSIKAAGIYLYSDIYYYTWSAPAGFNRGKIQNVFDISFDVKNDEAGKLYQQAWNYAVNYPIGGIILEGQKTMQLQKTALDRVNVRRLLIYLEKTVVNIARRFLYEGNTEYTRQLFIDTVRPIFEDVKRQNGISDYAIRCDETNNTPQTIENNEMRAIFAIKPIKVVEWIVCNFIVTNQNQNVSEEIMN